MHDAMQDGVTNILYMTTFTALLPNGSDKQRHGINEYAILLVFHGSGPDGMCEVMLGMVDAVCGDAQQVTRHLESVIVT